MGCVSGSVWGLLVVRTPYVVAHLRTGLYLLSTLDRDIRGLKFEHPQKCSFPGQKLNRTTSLMGRYIEHASGWAGQVRDFLGNCCVDPLVGNMELIWSSQDCEN